MEVGIRELRNHLSKWVARARKGEEIVITDRGKPVARLVGADRESNFDRLVREGIITPPKSKKRHIPKKPIPNPDGVRLSEYVLEDPRAEVICYFDASAFVKLVLPETGSAEALDLWRHADRATSSCLLYPEARSALARASRLGRVNRPWYRRARELLQTLWRDIYVVALVAQLADRAGDLAEEHALKASDAVHLASATAITDSDLVFVASDSSLLDAAGRVGLTVTVV